MNKETLISLLILGVGLACEYFYLKTDSTFLGVKLYLIGALCTIIGLLGLWFFAILPLINKRLDHK